MMENLSELRNIKTEPNDLLSDDEWKIPTVMQMTIVKEENDLLHSEININTDKQEHETELPVFAGTSHETYPICDTKFEIDEPMVTIVRENQDVAMKDPLDVSTEIKGPFESKNETISAKKTKNTLSKDEMHASPENVQSDNENENQLLGSEQQFSQNTHDGAHTGDKHFICHICKNSFDKIGNLNTHMLIHNCVNTHKCETCEESFGSKRDLARHMLIHSGEGWTCDICKGVFKKRSGLGTHMRVHSDEKPYKCDICMKGFRTTSGLNTHLLVHSDEKPFSCNECDKTFKSDIILVRHKMTHSGETPFTCNVCNKSFPLKNTLIRHIRYHHTGEKPYSCDVCSKSFTEKHVLIRHRRLHTGDKPYSCDICSRSFVQKYSLTNHEKTHKKNNDVC